MRRLLPSRSLRLFMRHRTERYDVTEWLKDPEAQETFGRFSQMLRESPALRDEFVAFYHDKYAKRYSLPESLVRELLTV